MGTATRALSRGWFIFVGLLLILVGIFALTYQFWATVFSVYVIGVILCVAGVIIVINSLAVHRVTKPILWFIMGVVYVIAGIICLTRPVEAASVLTLILAFTLLVSGVSQFLSALKNTSIGWSWFWLLLSGIVTFVLGVLILIGYPFDSTFILGLFLGIDFILQGWAYFMIGITIKFKLSPEELEKQENKRKLKEQIKEDKKKAKEEAFEAEVQRVHEKKLEKEHRKEELLAAERAKKEAKAHKHDAEAAPSETPASSTNPEEAK